MSCDNNITFDESGSHHADSSAGAFINNTFFHVGNGSCFFDGSGDYVEWNDASWNSITSDFSVCAWVYLLDNPRTNGHGILAKSPFTGAHGSYQALIGGTDGFMYSIINGEVDADNEVRPQDTWEHLCWSFNDTGNIIKYYANGFLRPIDAVVTSPTDTGDNVRIGQYYNDPTHSLYGYMDEVVFYDRLLDDGGCVVSNQCGGDVGDLYNNGTGMSFPEIEVLTINTDIVNNTINYNLETFNITYNGSTTNGDLFDCFLLDSGEIIDTQLEVNLSENNLFIVDTSNTERDFLFAIECNSDKTIYNVSSYVPEVGTSVGSDTLLDTLDGVSVNVTETIGTPAFDLYYNFTSVTTFEDIIFRFQYDGSPTHDVDMEIFNWSNLSFTPIFTIGQNTEFENATVHFEPENLTNVLNSSRVHLRIVHNDAGNPNHVLRLDYLTLHEIDINATTGEFSVRVDSINPRITSSFVNNSVFLIGQAVVIDWTCTDPNVFATNLTIFESDGSVAENIFGTNMTGLSPVRNVSSRIYSTIQNNTLRLECWDSHTDNKVKPISYNLMNDGVITIDLGLYFRGDFKQKLTEFWLNDKQDRYKMKITWNEDSFIHYINVSAVGDLIYVPSKYKGHFVWDYKRWIDFDGNNIKDVIVTPMNGYYQLEIHHYTKTDEIEFESIGDLNYITQTYGFSVQDESLVLEREQVRLLNLIYEAVIMIGLILYLIFTIIVYLLNTIKFYNKQVLIFTFISFIVLRIGFIAVDSDLFYICDFFFLFHLYNLVEIYFDKGLGQNLKGQLDD
jgi:hypothetical protein